MMKRKYFPIPKCELELYTSDNYNTIVEKIGKYATDKETARNRLYKIPEYLFIMETSENGFVLIPEQSNHYGKNNGVMPHLNVTYTEEDEKTVLNVLAYSDMIVYISGFIWICTLLCIFAGKYISGIVIFAIANTIMQIAFWLPCQKAISELEKLL